MHDLSLIVYCDLCRSDESTLYSVLFFWCQNPVNFSCFLFMLYYICHAGPFLAYNNSLIGENLMTMYKAYKHFLYAMDERCFLVNHFTHYFYAAFFLIAISLIKVINVIVVLIANYAKNKPLKYEPSSICLCFPPTTSRKLQKIAISRGHPDINQNIISDS